MKRLITVSEQVGAKDIDAAIAAAKSVAAVHLIGTITGLEVKAGLGSDSGRPLLWEIEVTGRRDSSE